MIRPMLQENNLNLLVNFILSNSKNIKKFSDRFSIDSRSIKFGQVFISLDEDKLKNHKNIKHAVKNGASAFVSQFTYVRKDINTIIPFLISKDIKYIYYKLFFRDLLHYDHKPKVIGITGTDGKTSTTLLLAQALSSCNKKVGVISSEGSGLFPSLKKNNYTTPTIDIIYKYYEKYLSKKCDYIIIECSSQGLHQGRVNGINFDYSLITNIYSDHLDYHKNLNNYIKSKLLIIDQSKSVILNHDSSILRKIKLSKYKGIKFNFISNKINKNKNIIKSSVYLDASKLKNFNYYSILFIQIFMKLENYKKDIIIKCIRNLKPLAGRRQIIKTKNKGTFIIDYAHTIQSYENIYNDFISNETITTLFGCGGDRDETKREITGKIVDKFSSFIIITEDNSRTEEFNMIVKKILNGIKKKHKYKIIESRKKALDYLFKNSKHDDLNFILGKGNEDYLLKNNCEVRHNDIVYLKQLIYKYEN